MECERYFRIRESWGIGRRSKVKIIILREAKQTGSDVVAAESTECLELVSWCKRFQSKNYVLQTNIKKEDKENYEGLEAEYEKIAET